MKVEVGVTYRGTHTGAGRHVEAIGSAVAVRFPHAEHTAEGVEWVRWRSRSTGRVSWDVREVFEKWAKRLA